jgi:hypothetical protein
VHVLVKLLQSYTKMHGMSHIKIRNTYFSKGQLFFTIFAAIFYWVNSFATFTVFACVFFLIHASFSTRPTHFKV